MRSHELGRTSETLACSFLKARGWRILERNYRAGHKEIDIIASRGGTVAFIEVKARAGNAWGHALEAITWAKRREIAHVARTWIGTHPAAAKEYRFDAIAITWRGTSYLIEHVENAWTLR
jgi:putative endonuclease